MKAPSFPLPPNCSKVYSDFTLACKERIRVTVLHMEALAPSRVGTRVCAWGRLLGQDLFHRRPGLLLHGGLKGKVVVGVVTCVISVCIVGHALSKNKLGCTPPTEGHSNVTA